MNPLFDSAGLAIVAYVEVSATGTSTDNNSGVTTSHVSTGIYSVTLPTNKVQVVGRDLFIVEPLGSVPLMHAVDEVSAAQKNVTLSNGMTFVDGTFNVIILRTIVPPPYGAPA